jgi:hypothetical protein
MWIQMDWHLSCHVWWETQILIILEPTIPYFCTNSSDWKCVSCQMTRTDVNSHNFSGCWCCNYLWGAKKC